MARYSRVRGPASDFNLVATYSTPTGFSITRSFGRGVILAGGVLTLLNTAVTNQDYRGRINIDAGAQLSGELIAIEEGLRSSTISPMGLFSIEPGIHTVELELHGGASPFGRVLAGRSEFVVIELPAWDLDDFLIDL